VISYEKRTVWELKKPFWDRCKPKLRIISVKIFKGNQMAQLGLP
jgi:hypothetical protein